MKRTVMIVAVLMLLTLPLGARADDQGWMPPEWTPTPPARHTVDLEQVVQVLRPKWVLTDHEYGRLTPPSLPSFARQGHDIEHNPVRSSGGD
jgi:hypothetical protein